MTSILPILFYHGKERWRCRALAALFKDLDRELRPFIPDYDYIFHDLGEIPDEHIETLENKFLQASLLALKYSQLRTELVKWIPTILSLAMGAQENLEQNIIVYTFGVSGLKEDEIITLIEKVPSTNPIEKIIELHDQKIALYERMIKEKDEMMGMLKKLVDNIKR